MYIGQGRRGSRRASFAVNFERRNEQVSTFLQTLFVGLRLGSIYALVALGYTMVYGIIRLINFAHGDFIMVGGYTMIFTVPVMIALGLPAWVSVFLAILVCALVGMSTELIAYRPVRKKGTSMSALITAIAVSLLLENLAQAIPQIGPNPKVASQIFTAGGIRIADVTLDWTTMLTIFISVVVMVVLYQFTQKTKVGRAMRCVSEDKPASILMGINVNRTIVTTFAIGSGLAAIAALMYMAQYPKVYTTMGALCWVSRLSSRPFWAASVSSRELCSADLSSALSNPSPPAMSAPAWRMHSCSSSSSSC